MLIALEGPDLSGKTTCFGRLRNNLDGAVFVPSIKSGRRADMSEVERRQEFLWRCLYDERRLYVCDRHVSVSAQVYAIIKGRKLLFDPQWWFDKVHVVYFDVPYSELEKRYRRRGDDFVAVDEIPMICTHYRKVLSSFKNVSVDACNSDSVVAKHVRQAIERWRCG